MVRCWQWIAKGTRHSTVVNRLARLIHTILTSRPEVLLELRVESPLDLGATSEPEPETSTWCESCTAMAAPPTPLPRISTSRAAAVPHP